MVTVASKYFDGVGYRGMFSYRGMLRFTLMRFVDDGNFSAQEQSELWALKLLLRYRGIFAPSPTLPQMQEQNLGEGE